MQRTRQLIVFLLVVAASWFFLTGMGTVKASQDEIALASFIFLVCCIPATLYFLRSEQNIPYLPLFGIIYFFYYGFSIFNSYKIFISYGLTKESIVTTLQYSLWGIISLLLAFYTPLGQVVEAFSLPVKLPWDPQKAYKMGVLSALVGFPCLYVLNYRAINSTIAGVVVFLHQFAFVSIVIFLVLQIQKKLKRGQIIFLWAVLVPAQMFLSLSGGATLPLVVNICMLFFVFIYFSKSLPISRAFFALVLFFLVFSVRDEYRGQMWNAASINISPLERGRIYARLIYEKISMRDKGTKEYFTSAYERLSGRSDSLATFVRVVDLTPSMVPYWHGYSYSTIIYNFIPRIIMPNKPSKNLGQEFGHRYNLLLMEDNTTSYNFPVLVEMYANFGQQGVIVGMFLIGLFLRWFYKTFNHEDAGECGIILTVVVLGNVLVLDSDFSLMFGAVFYYIILFYIFVKKMQYKTDKTTSEN